MKITITSDGSHTIYLPELNEHYHSTHGSIQESSHVFIEAGLMQMIWQKDKLNILEVGFGTGLNCLLTYECITNHLKVNVDYTSLEPFPVDREVALMLNYPSLLSMEKAKSAFELLHHLPWNVKSALDNNINVLKMNSTLQNFIPIDRYDLVYFDAFSPNVQPELWSFNNFEKIYKSMNPNAILVTYCAKGIVKRTLKSVGFKVESIPGPPGKREMIRARKIDD